MKTRYFFNTLLIFILTVGCSQEYLVVKRGDDKLKRKVRKLHYDGEPFTGEVVNYYTKPNDDLEPIQVETEILESKTVYNDGLPVELYTYWKDGSPRRKCSYKNNTPHNLNGYQHGQDIEYYQNGQIKSNSYFQDGNRHGQSINYDEDGTLRFKGNYIDGEEDGEFYSKRNNYETKSNYVNGKEDGEWIRIYNSEKNYDGKEIKVYDNGNLISETKFYNNDIGLHKKIFYENGRRTGKYVEYTHWDNYYGDDYYYLFKSGNYVNGKEDGEWIINQGSGSGEYIQTKTIYKNGRKISESKSPITYDEIKK